MKAAIGMVLGLGMLATGCGSSDFEGESGLGDGEAIDEGSLSGDVLGDEEGELSDAVEVGTSQQALLFNNFSFKSSCSDATGTQSVLAALAVAAATELKRWQPTADFYGSFGVYRLTETGKAQCADKKCWNTQAILDLQHAPNLKVEVRPGVKLDVNALKLAIHASDWAQFLMSFITQAPAHKFELKGTEKGGCDTFYWFDVKTPSGGTVLSSLLPALQRNLDWVGGSNNPYIQFQTNGTLVGIDPTYGLNEVGSTSTGTCTAACTKMSATNIAGQCCSCNGNKKFARSAWSTTTYICQ
jgi:hypothetical protein